MPKKAAKKTIPEEPILNSTRAIIYTAIAIPFAIPTYWLLTMAALSLCGISGCSGGGFGVAFNPGGVQRALFLSGVVASIAPLIIFFVSKRQWWWIMITIGTFIFVPLVGAFLIGSGLDGYPTWHNRY